MFFRYVYCISDVRIFVFNAKTGKRLHILPFTDKHLAVYANDDYVSLSVRLMFDYNQLVVSYSVCQ